MPYAAEISRTNPTCFLFLIDQSSSMAEPFGGQPEQDQGRGRGRRHQPPAAKPGPQVRQVGRHPRLLPRRRHRLRRRRRVRRWAGRWPASTSCPISEIANNPLRVEQRTRKVDDGAGGLVEQKFKFPVWFEPVADGQTPMCQAPDAGRPGAPRSSSPRSPDCYPPLVINITDGKATDGDPRDGRQAAARPGHDATATCCCSTPTCRRQPTPPIEFPASESGLPDHYARLLFRMSSALPPQAAGGGPRRRLRGRPTDAAASSSTPTWCRSSASWTSAPASPRACADHDPRRPPACAGALCLPKRGNTADEYEDAFAGRPGAGPLRRGRRRLGKLVRRPAGRGCWSRASWPPPPAPAGLAARPGERWAARGRWAWTCPGTPRPSATRAPSPRFLGLAASARAGRRGRPWPSATAACSRCAADGLLEAFPLRRSRGLRQPAAADRLAVAGRRRRRGARRVGAATGRPGDRFLLMTDALAQWFLRHARGGRAALAGVARPVASPSADRRSPTGSRSAGATAGNDDVTVVMIDCEPSSAVIEP